MEHLRLYPRYHHLTRKELGSPRIVTGTPDDLALVLRRAAKALGHRIWLLADENTAAAAPELVDALGGGERASMLPGTPAVVPEIALAEQIAAEAVEAGSRAIVVIGGGTLTDLAKYAARVADLELLCVPSAASVDAYTSARSALRIAGYHRTPDARVPTAILASPAIIDAAPDPLKLAGLGDLVAKLIARLDWQLGAFVTGEEFALREADWSAYVARHAFARLRQAGLRAASFPALDALLVTGRTMLVFGSSRPSASSEHTMAHLWEIALDDTVGERYHGLLVARAAEHVITAYRWIVARLRTGTPAGPSPHDSGRDWERHLPSDMHRFVDKMREETGTWTLTAAVAAERRSRIDSQRARIVELAERAIVDAERGLYALEMAGIGAYLPEIPHRWVARSLQWVRHLRNRYSMFNLAFEMGWEPELLDHLDASP
jgi:glycerol-1-phosphate dehydrogenase [NAD(P)+]